jgi:RNA 2',3'-cyclic 3'-phosphodiesterase
VRLFLAVEPDRAAHAGLAALLAEVQNGLGQTASALRWTAPDNIHATLHFLGEVDQARAARLPAVLGDRVAHAAFDVATGGLGIFPGSGPPRVLWLSIATGAEALRALHVELASRLGQAGVAPEERAFSPHLTLGRVRDHERRRAATLRQRLAALRLRSVHWLAREVVLFRSDLSGPVARHEPIHVMRLEGTDATR